MRFYSVLAGIAGFEPTSDGVKVRCLTAWRQLIIKNKNRIGVYHKNTVFIW